jgi:hypothetical protein
MFVGHAETRCEQVSHHGDDALPRLSPALSKLFEAFAGALTDEDVDRALAP